MELIFGIYLVASLTYIWYQDRANRQERQDYKDRLMAIAQPVALISHKAAQDPEPARVTYVDEAYEAQTIEGNGNVDLLGDE